MNISIVKRLLLPETKEERDLKKRLEASIDRILDTLDIIDSKMDNLNTEVSMSIRVTKKNGDVKV